MPLTPRFLALATFALSATALGSIAADPPKKDEKKDSIYYTVEKQKQPGILKVVVHDTPLGNKEVTIDTNPKNSAGIRNERPVAIDMVGKEPGKEFTLSVEMNKGGLTVKSVAWNGKKVPLLDPKKKTAEKKPVEKAEPPKRTSESCSPPVSASGSSPRSARASAPCSKHLWNPSMATTYTVCNPTTVSR
jgi:hypothetical protein